MDKSLYGQMFSCENNHWWFLAKREIVLYFVSKILENKKQPKICDIGCGTGALLQELNRFGIALGMDSSEDAIEFCSKKGITNVKKGKLPDDIPFEKNFFDLILLLDVLEHIDDEETVLKSCKQLLKPGGSIIITVPAYKLLWTKRDDFHHHKRRYTKHQLIKAVKDSGLSITKISYYNTLLFPLALLARISTKLLKTEKDPDLILPASPINRTMRFIFASEKYFLKYFNFPFGLSLVSIVS